MCCTQHKPVLSLLKEDALDFHMETPCKFLLMGEQVDTLHPGLYSKLTGYLGVFFLKDARCSGPWDFQN